MSLCQQSPGSHFSGNVHVWSDTPALAARLAQIAGLNLWFGVNALGTAARGRGTADDVVRLAALIADLDLNAGGCPDLAIAFAIIAAVSAADVGSRRTRPDKTKPGTARRVEVACLQCRVLALGDHGHHLVEFGAQDQFQRPEPSPRDVFRYECFDRTGAQRVATLGRGDERAPG